MKKLTDYTKDELILILFKMAEGVIDDVINDIENAIRHPEMRDSLPSWNYFKKYVESVDKNGKRKSIYKMPLNEEEEFEAELAEQAREEALEEAISGCIKN